GFPIEISKTLMKEMIQALRPQDLFNVMVFEGSSALWSPASQPATPEHLQQALDFVRQQNAGGGTELGAALKRALTLPRVPGVSRSFVVSTDGYISADASVFDIIRQHLGDANLFAFGIGSSVNRLLIEGMAHAGQGEPFVVMNPGQAAAEAERFRAYVSAPALSNVKLHLDGFQAYDIEPAHLPDVLAERPVLCFGKWKGEAAGTLTVSGMTGQGRWQQSFKVGDVRASSSAALRQLWARERIRLLSDYNQFGENDERKKEVTCLGLTYNLLTAYTSFVAVDTQVRNAGGQPSTVVQPLPMPAGVSDAAIGQSNQPSGHANYGAGLYGSGAGGRAPAYKAMGAPASAPMPAQERQSRVDALGDLEALKEEPKKDKTRGALLQALNCDQPGLKLTAARAELESKLKDPAFAKLLGSLPKGAVLTLQLDSAGRVTAASFDRAFAGSVQVLARIRAWRFTSWTAPAATLKATLSSRP
ncbi:MAG TPA: hypothetical protein VJ483_09480, partial [Holophagaceae bacterium]|nr:hypothetical protein [Holophagaceae bacterium]